MAKVNETKIMMLRHAQSIGNAKEIYLGHTDLDLSEEGYKQAEMTAQALCGLKIDAVYSSDLLRAHNTALPHAAMRGLPVIDSQQLREVFLGDWEGAKISDLKTVWYNEYVGGWKKHFGTYCPPGGESVQHAAERIYNEVLHIAREHIGETVLIASHAAAIRCFWGRVSQIPPEELADAVPFPTNTSVTTVIYDGEDLKPVKYSDDSHL